MHQGKLDRADLKPLRSERSHLQHFLECDAVETSGLWDNLRVGRVDAVNIGIDVAAVSANRRGNRHRARIRTSPPQRNNTGCLLMETLKPGDDRDLPPLGKTLNDCGGFNMLNTPRSMTSRGKDRVLPALPGTGGLSHFQKQNREQPGGHLFAGSANGVILPPIAELGSLIAPADELIGFTGH